MRRDLLFLTIVLVLTGCAKQTRPLIGISCGGSETMTSLKTTYSDAVRLAGGIPVLIPVTKDSAAIEETLCCLDAVIMSGGEDLDPRFYGEDPLPELGKVNAARDTFDVLMIRSALRRGKPILGICRGEQIINVVLGGTLYQDIPSQIPGSELVHRQTEPGSAATQTIDLVPGTRLAGILGAERIGVNSFHHQAVKDLAPGLVVSARTEDGVIEAYESSDGEQILCVQFHPEAFAQAGDAVFLRIFQDLVRRAGK